MNRKTARRVRVTSILSSLFAAALVSLGQLALAQETQSEAAKLPPVEISQDAAPAAAKKKAKQPVKKEAAAPKPNVKLNPQPAPGPAATGTPDPLGPPESAAATTSDAASSNTGASAPVAAGTRSGSLGVPNTTEARAEIERTPGAVDVVSDKEYKTSTPSVTIKDALDYVPGVFVQPKFGEDSRLSIRGSGLSRNFHGRGVQLLMDGVLPITTADGNSDFQEIDPTAYRYIEVYKGGNALRYGANSLGGAINFVMPTGYDSDLFGMRTDIGSFGFHKVTASSGGVFGAADYFITGTWQEQDGFRDHSEGESTRLAMNIGYRLTPDIETRFYLNTNTIRQSIPGAVTRDEALTNPERAFVRPGQPSGFFSIGNDNVDRDYRRNIDSTRVANRTTVRLARGTVVELGGFYFDRHLDHPIFAIVDNENEEYGGFARLVDDRWIGGTRNRLIAGVNVHNGDVRARLFRNELGSTGPLRSDANQKSKNTTVYAENSFFVTPTVALVAGLQYADISRSLTDRFLSNGDESRAADFQFWSPKAGVVWDVTPTAQIFANVSRSQEAPTFNEITINAGDVVALDPQESTTYEIGTRGRLPGFHWDLAVYHARLENEFQCLAVGSTGTCTQVNIDRSIHQGVEVGGGAALISGLFVSGERADEVWLNAAYTYSDFRFDGDATFGDNDLPGAPRHAVRAELLYKHPSGIYAGPNVEWIPEAYVVDSANTFKTEAYALLGAKLGFDNGGSWTAYIEGRNLTDEAYISSANIATTANANSTPFEPGSGRAVYGGVQIKW